MIIQKLTMIDLRYSVINSPLDDLKKDRGVIQGRLKKIKDEEKKTAVTKELDEINLKIQTAESELQRMRDEGDYEFKEKVLLSFRDVSRMPPYFFTWKRYEPNNNYREFREAKVDGWRPVTKDEPYWPSPLPPDEHGYYVAGDVIWMKRSLKDHIMEKLANEKRNINLASDKLKAFNDELKSMGANIPDGMAEEFGQQILDSTLSDYRP